MSRSGCLALAVLSYTYVYIFIKTRERENTSAKIRSTDRESAREICGPNKSATAQARRPKNTCLALILYLMDAKILILFSDGPEVIVLLYLSSDVLQRPAYDQVSSQVAAQPETGEMSDSNRGLQDIVSLVINEPPHLSKYWKYFKYSFFSKR
jgi:hypothetical protein